jgi:hypothetical protein
MEIELPSLPPTPDVASPEVMPSSSTRLGPRMGWSSRARVSQRPQRLAEQEPGSSDGIGFREADNMRGIELQAETRAALAALPPLILEAAHAGGLWREAFPDTRVRAVASTLSSMLDALNLMHETLGALQPGGVGLVAPLLKPINRVEAQVVLALRALLQKLQAGVNADGGARFSAASPAVKLFDECYAECLGAIVQSNRVALSSVRAGAGAMPTLSNGEVLTFNALVYSIKSLCFHIERASERLDELFAMQAPLDLARVAFV